MNRALCSLEVYSRPSTVPEYPEEVLNGVGQLLCPLFADHIVPWYTEHCRGVNCELIFRGHPTTEEGLTSFPNMQNPRCPEWCHRMLAGLIVFSDLCHQDKFVHQLTTVDKNQSGCFSTTTCCWDHPLGGTCVIWRCPQSFCCFPNSRSHQFVPSFGNCSPGVLKKRTSVSLHLTAL